MRSGKATRRQGSMSPKTMFTINALSSWTGTDRLSIVGREAVVEMRRWTVRYHGIETARVTMTPIMPQRVGL